MASRVAGLLKDPSSLSEVARSLDGRNSQQMAAYSDYPYPLISVDPDGLYEVTSCKGSDEECERWKKHLKAGIVKAKAALKSDDLNKEQKAELKKVLDHLGTEGDGTDMRIAFGETKEGSLSTTHGANMIKINGAALDQAFGEIAKDKEGYDLDVEFGARAVEESTHSFDIFTGKFDFKYRGGFTPFQAAEERSYNNGSLVFKGLNINSIHRIWMKAWKEPDRDYYRKDAVEARATGSVNLMKRWYLGVTQ